MIIKGKMEVAFELALGLSGLWDYWKNKGEKKEKEKKIRKRSRNGFSLGKEK